MLQTVKRRWPYIVLEHGGFKVLSLRAPFMPESAVESNECMVNLFTHPWFNDCAFRSDIGKVNSLCTLALTNDGQDIARRTLLHILKNTKSLELGFSFPMCTVKNFDFIQSCTHIYSLEAS